MTFIFGALALLGFILLGLASSAKKQASLATDPVKLYQHLAAAKILYGAFIASVLAMLVVAALH